MPPSVDLKSPYNTRVVKGLPPGPISNVRIAAFKAIAEPTDTQDVYFVAGDDGITYFSQTLEQHEAKVKQYCKIGCQL